MKSTASPGEAIRLIEEFGIETPDGLIKALESMFKKSTVNRYLQQWGYDRETLRRQPAAVRFQAEHSNDCWQFDLSPSDLKEVKEPLWLQANKGARTLMHGVSVKSNNSPCAIISLIFAGKYYSALNQLKKPQGWNLYAA